MNPFDFQENIHAVNIDRLRTYVSAANQDVASYHLKDDIANWTIVAGLIAGVAIAVFANIGVGIAIAAAAALAIVFLKKWRHTERLKIEHAQEALETIQSGCKDKKIPVSIKEKENTKHYFATIVGGFIKNKHDDLKYFEIKLAPREQPASAPRMRHQDVFPSNFGWESADCMEEPSSARP